MKMLSVFSENKFPYSAIIFRSGFLVAPPIAEIGLKKKRGAAYRRER